MSINKDINTEQLVFALDIGTRTVIGLVGIYEGDTLKIIDSEIIEHDKRNMYDGQIHDINGVVQIVEKVKQRLEERLGIKLEKVAIAAAGRALKTYRIRVDRNIDSSREIDKRLIESLEMEAIQKAQDLQDKSINKGVSKYYCVGYTVINYYLDDTFIENLEGHHGDKIGAEVLATFLPHVVVDSLYTVMSRMKLEVINITLEPIAAINVAIKKNLRLLNLALVDIGAGTSDIAITKDGTIIAYAMVPIAGDEITESIAKKYLLDYDSAEKLKVNLNVKKEHKFYDIVGIEHNLTTEEILDSVDDDIKKLAKEIADKILEYNEKAPSAIFLIGGGSQIPRLPQHIAQYLSLPKERVVVRSTDIIQEIDGISEKLIGPHAITPIGIAKTAIENRNKDFLEVTVNGQKVKLFNSKELKVSDALVLVGFNPKKLIPKRGEDFVYYLNGNKATIRGEFGEPAIIYVNKERSSLDQKLKNGDIVEVIEATVGKMAELYLYDCINIDKTINFNGKEVKLIREVRVNGITTVNNIPITENDRIDVEEIKTVKELFEYLNLNPENCIIYKNGVEVDIEEDLKANDIILADNIGQKHDEKTLNVVINGKKLKINHQKDKFVFVDIFNYIDFDLSRPKGLITLKANGSKADYLQELKDGDEIEIYWENIKED